MGNHKIHKLREKLMEELEKHCKEGDLTTADMEAIYKISESVKAIDTICAMEDSGEDGYSGRGTNRRYSYANYNNSYESGKEYMAHKLNEMMMGAQDPHTRDILKSAISKLES